jgi:hypothetical protein
MLASKSIEIAEFSPGIHGIILSLNLSGHYTNTVMENQFTFVPFMYHSLSWPCVTKYISRLVHLQQHDIKLNRLVLVTGDDTKYSNNAVHPC